MCSPLRLIRLPLHVCWVFTRNPPNQIRIGSGKRIKKWMQTKETGWNVGMWLSYPYLDYGLDRLGLPQFSQWIGNTDSTVILKCPNFLGILQLDLQCAQACLRVRNISLLDTLCTSMSFFMLELKTNQLLMNHCWVLWDDAFTQTCACL